jgi:hypothetical protein
VLASCRRETLQALVLGNPLGNSPILGDPKSSPFCRGHQVKWFVHYYAFFMISHLPDLPLYKKAGAR